MINECYKILKILGSPPGLQIHPPLVADEEDVFRDNLSNVLFVDEGGGEGNNPI
jgi:hypothetical protein